MPSIAVDHGCARIKVATYDHAAGKPVLVELGREIRATIPSLVYVPADGPILIGDDAQHEGVRDPEGIVRQLKRDLLKPGPVRHDRDIERPELAATLFRSIREDSQRLLLDGQALTAGCFTVPLDFRREQEDALTLAAQRAGFQQVTLVSEPVAAARFYQRQLSLKAPALVVCDVGASATDITLLDCRDGDARPYLGIRRAGLKEGADGIDDAIWDALTRDRLDEFSIECVPTLRLQLRHVKELAARLRRAEEKLYLGEFTLSVTRGLVEGCFQAFIQRLQDELSRFTTELRRAGVSDVPLLLAGGGSQIPGLVAASQKIGWPGPIHLRRDAEFAAVLGAVELPAPAVRSLAKKTIFDPDKGIKGI